MIRNYFVTIWRNLGRNKLYTIINVFCLSLGITGAILISLFIHHEFSFDKYHNDNERIYRINGHYNIGGNSNFFAITPFPLGLALEQEYEQVENMVRVFYNNDVRVNVNDINYLEDMMAFTDTTFFDIFTHNILYGDTVSPLSSPFSVVLSNSLSNKYFGEGYNPTGKKINLNKEIYTITAVMEDFPSNSHLQLDALISMNSIDNGMMFSVSPNLFWNINTNYTYIKLKEGAQVSEIEDNLDGFYEKYTEPVGSIIGGKTEFSFSPLREMRFSEITFSPNSISGTTVYVLSIVAIFLIIIAAVNYTNLSTARASVRYREVGIRKVSGAGRGQLIMQFLSESFLISLISLIFSFILIEFIITDFNRLSEKNFAIVDILQWPFVLNLFLIILVTGFLAGIYPAYFISRMNPTHILRASRGSKGGSLVLRKSLVVFQFAISIMLITGTLMVQNQLEFLQKKDLGLTISNRAILRISDMDKRLEIEGLQESVMENEYIVNTSKMSSVPGRGFNKIAVWIENGLEMKEKSLTINYIDTNYFNLFEIEIVEGRNFDISNLNDRTDAAIINQKAAKKFGWEGEELGKTIQWMFDSLGNPMKKLKVVGVVEDHNLLNLNHPVEPVMYILADTLVSYAALVAEYNDNHEQEVVDFLKQKLLDFDEDTYPDIQFVKSGFSQQFENEERLSTIFTIFAVVCILISFIGLFGLSSYITEQRKREIGVRKVLGSSGLGVMGLFIKEFLILIFIAIIFTIPVTWYLIDIWLDKFVYRIPVTILPFIISAGISIAIALLTISYHTLKAASINPAEIIRAE